MKKYCLFLLFCISSLIFSFSVDAKKQEDVSATYQIEGAGTGSSGTALVKITCVNKKKDKITENILCKCAVHGVLFRGYSDSTVSSYGAGSRHPAIMGSPMAETQNIDFFKPFFEDGTFSGYTEYVQESRRVIKVGKEYRVSATVAVSVAQLRKDLEKIGILKSLKSGW